MKNTEKNNTLPGFSNNKLSNDINNYKVENYNINNLINLGYIRNANNNLQNVLLNSMYKNISKNFPIINS